jgi:hypothetical protein
VLPGGTSIELFENNGVILALFDVFKKHERKLKHCFTTRRGGVSRDECCSLNMGFNRKDERENVLENFRRVCASLGIKLENLVFSNQVHDNRIRIVTEADRGKGILRDSDIVGYDGLVTNRREVALVTFYADCVPVFLYDSSKEVISLVHSGWRSTVKEISREAITVMKGAYGCNPGDIEAAVGPSIGSCCYEVGEDTYKEFEERLPWALEHFKQTGAGKWKVSLQGIINHTLKDCGVAGENISMSNLCTRCFDELFFSHRRDKGKTGSMAAIMQLV